MTKENLREFNDLLKIEYEKGNPISDLDEFKYYNDQLDKLAKTAQKSKIIEVCNSTVNYVEGGAGISFNYWIWTLKAGKLAGDDIDLVDLDE